MDVYNLRVAGKVSGRRFPFNRLYLVRHADRHRIKDMFRYSLVLPVEGLVSDLLHSQIVPETVQNHNQYRDDAAPAKMGSDAWLELLQSTTWVVVIPLLPRPDTLLPNYLTARGWYTPRNRRATPFPRRSYLQTPERQIRPICIICPNHIQHENDRCRLGEGDCYTALALGVGDPEPIAEDGTTTTDEES